MSLITDIQTAQNSLEQTVMMKMAEFEMRLQSGGSAKETVAKVAEEFRTFRELVFSMFDLLRKQVMECSRMIDGIETRSRRKSLVFSGIAEAVGENCASVVSDIMRNKMALRNLSTPTIKVCHRLGSPKNDHHRPILVKFVNVDLKSDVWKAKSLLKGTNVSVKEFLTRSRQTAFGLARQHFGMKSCWTQDGTIIIKTPDGKKHKITNTSELNPLLEKYPKVSGESSSVNRDGCASLITNRNT